LAVSAAAWYEELKSGPGWPRLLEQRGAQLLVIALLVALAIDSALILTRILGALAPPAPAPAVHAAPARPAVNPSVELATIVNAHLFGLPGATAGGAAPQTTMPLILAGVIADKDPTKGQAIIGDSAAGAKLVSVGAMIPGGVRLNSVYGDRVLIERNGRLETLLLPRTPAKSGAGARASAPTAQTAAAHDNATLLAGLVRVTPVYDAKQNKLLGYRITPAGARGTSAFNQLGLRAGDLIVAVNGTALDDAGRAMEIMQTLSSSATATVTVTRGNQTQEVNLNLANLNTDLDTVAADNASAASAEAPPGTGAQMRGRGAFTAAPTPPPGQPGAAAGMPGQPQGDAPPLPAGAAAQQ